MTHDLNKFIVQEVLRGFAPPAQAQKIAAWAVANADRFAPQEAKKDGNPERIALARAWVLLREGHVTDRATAGNALMADYSRVHDARYCAAGENTALGLDFLARKFHYADAQSLAQHQPELRTALAAALAAHQWRNYYFVHLSLENKDREYALNTLWSDWSKVAEGRWQDLLKEREQASCEGAYAKYDREELFAATSELLRVNRDRDYTYNEAAKALKIHPSAVAQIMQVKDALERVASPAGTYKDVAKFKTKRGKRTAEVFKWSPARRRIEAAIPSQRDGVISGEIMTFLDATPYQSVRALQAHCREAFGRIDNSKVIACLRALVEDKVALTEKGARGAILHYPNPKIQSGSGM